MLSILRNGPKFIVFGSTEPQKLASFLKDTMVGMVTDLSSALEAAEEDNTVIFITSPGKKVARLGDVKAVVLVPYSCDYLFSELINMNAPSFIKDSHISPGTLIMRVVGDFDSIMQSINNTYKCTTMSLEECLDSGKSNQTILSFTEKSLSKKLSIHDLKPQHLLVDMETNKLSKKLRFQALRFLNEGFVGVDWNDLQIRIYDKYCRYKLHYDRLSLVLDNLDMGLILGESWSKDYPRPLLSVLVYQVRLFTLLQTVEIKRILLGLEYLDDGTRIVDYDLMKKNNKIEWRQTLDKSATGYSRSQLSKKYRQEILDKLDSEERKKMFALEDDILKTRY